MAHLEKHLEPEESGGSEELVRIEERPDTICIFSPYNAEFVREIKTIPGRRWTGKCWEVPLEFRSEAEAIVKKYFPPPEEKVRTYWYIEATEEDTSPSIDGVDIVTFTRDWGRARSTPTITVLYSRIRTGGSRKYPHWSGNLVVVHEGRPDPVGHPRGVFTKLASYEEARRKIEELGGKVGLS